VPEVSCYPLLADTGRALMGAVGRAVRNGPNLEAPAAGSHPNFVGALRRLADSLRHSLLLCGASTPAGLRVEARVRPFRLPADCSVAVAGDGCPLPPAALLESVVRQSPESAVADLVLGVAPQPRLAASVLGLPIALTRVLLGLTSEDARPIPAATVQALLRALTIAVGNVAGFRLHHLGACPALALALPCAVLDPRLLMLCGAGTALGAIGRRPLAVAAEVVADERSRGVAASRAAFAVSSLALYQG